ncbi:MAG: adenylate/guanylate cyclase domain-containing protein, partial [Mesorhizobium sp.]
GPGMPGKPRPLRRDIYHPIPGDVMFEERIHGETAYLALGAPWYRRAMDSTEPVWSVIDVLPNGFEPSVVVSKRVELYGRYQGVVMVAVSFANLSQALGGLQVSGHGKTFVLGGGDKVLAASDAPGGP